MDWKKMNSSKSGNIAGVPYSKRRYCKCAKSIDIYQMGQCILTHFNKCITTCISYMNII